MTRKILLLGLMLGVAGVAGANEARAVAVLDTARLEAQTTPTPLLTPVGFKRHGVHRGFGGVAKSFRGLRSFSGKPFAHGGSARLFSGKRFGHGDVVVRKQFRSPRLFHGKRFGHGDVVVRKQFRSPRLFFGKRFGDGVVVRKGFAGPRLFRGKRFGHRPFFSDRHLRRFHR